MHLKFPELRGGPVQGLNDAGVENFQGAIDVYLSRECGQNTGDAPRPGVQTVRLDFDRIMLSAEEIPAFKELRATLAACLDRWKHKESEREFFTQAVTAASQPKIPVLKISDYGTTGLTGDDLDQNGRWFALVKSQGVSIKDATAGGSFGIGKSSPFAASRFRTVLYGTRTESGDVALQGVSRLVTHKDPQGKLTQGTGFIGEYDADGGEDGEPVFRAIRDEARIPGPFRRTEPGTDIWVIGYRSGPEWAADLTRSILANFWPAIHRGTIQFSVGGKIISSENLAELIEAHIGQEEFEAHHFYKSVFHEPVRKRLRHTGDCELYLTTGSADLPRRICMVRNSGMRIFDYAPKACRVPFAGLFICTDPGGNKLLRKLEPPKHDTWDPKRTDDQSGRKALDEIKAWIREEVKKLNPLFSGSSFNETELAKYIPDIEPEDRSDLPSTDSGSANEEKLEPRPKDEHPPVRPIDTKPVVAKPRPGSEGGPGGGSTREQTNEDGGAGAGGQGSTGRSTAEITAPVLHVRSFRSGGEGTYELILRSDRDYQGTVYIQAVGEDGQVESVSLISAKSSGDRGTSFEVARSAIRDVRLAGGTPLRITVKLDDIERRSLTAVVQP